MKSTPDMAIGRFVKRLTSRSTLTAGEISALSELHGVRRDYRTHADFVRVGDEADHASLVVDGLVCRFGQNREGDRQISGLYIQGDMADLPSVVNPTAGWGMSTLAPTTILRIPHGQLRRLAAEFPGIAEAFWRDGVADGSMFSEWVVSVGRRSALSRLAHLFCEMAIRSEQAGIGDRRSFRLPITQNDLGDATGLTNVHVNRTLKSMRAASIADLRSGQVTISNWDELVSVGDFNPAFLLLGKPAPRIANAAEAVPSVPGGRTNASS